MKIAITGHTEGLGKSFYNQCIARGHTVLGFSRSNNYDLRDYSKVSDMLIKVQGFNFFINNAKPDYAQAQIVYRLVREWKSGNIVSIGSDVVLNPPNWTDLFLLEYTTQKQALYHAHQVLSPISLCNLILLNPKHLGDNCDDYVTEQLVKLNL